MNDTEELIFHGGYKMSRPERHVGAARRRHMRLRERLINHEPQGAAAREPASICSALMRVF